MLLYTKNRGVHRLLSMDFRLCETCIVKQSLQLFWRVGGIPKLVITDSQINSVCREFYHNETFGVKDNQISMFDFHNLLTQSNKNSYIDSYISRAVKATEVATGINNALHGDEKYSWFIS